MKREWGEQLLDIIHYLAPQKYKLKIPTRENDRN